MRLATIALALTGGLSLIGISTAQQKPEKSAQVVRPTMIAKVYAVSDLPVWSKGGTKFDPSLLIRLLRSSVTDGMWNEKSSIVANAEGHSLVVNANPEAHQVITAELVKLRPEK